MSSFKDAKNIENKIADFYFQNEGKSTEEDIISRLENADKKTKDDLVTNLYNDINCYISNLHSALWDEVGTFPPNRLELFLVSGLITEENIETIKEIAHETIDSFLQIPNILEIRKERQLIKEELNNYMISDLSDMVIQYIPYETKIKGDYSDDRVIQP